MKTNKTVFERELAFFREDDEVQYTTQLKGFDFIVTAGHGYLVVPTDHIYSHVAKDILKNSGYGYRGEHAYYLEEDDEAPAFLRAVEKEKEDFGGANEFEDEEDREDYMMRRGPDFAKYDLDVLESVTKRRNNMKLTREDVMKYGTAEEKKLLENTSAAWEEKREDNTFKIVINVDNAAFEGDPSEEIHRIMKNLLREDWFGSNYHTIKDINGNTCGYVKWDFSGE